MNSPHARLQVLVAHSGAELYGADRVLLESVAGLVREGAAVSVTVPGVGALVSELERVGATVIPCRVPVLRKSSLNPVGLLKLAGGFVAGGVRGLRLIRSVRPDAIYVNTVTIPLWPLLGKLTRIPVLVHVHEAERTAPKLLRTALALPLVCSTSIVANSRYSAETLAQALPLLESRTTVIYNGVAGPAQLVPPRECVTAPLRLLYVGRLSGRKGVHTAIAAVAQARTLGLEVHLDVVGAVFPGYEWYAEQLQAQVAALNLGAFVTFHGFQRNVWKYYADADVAIVPSCVDEPFGDTAVEAVLAARPTIVSRTPGLSEAAGGFASVQFVEAGDAGAAAAALLRIHADWPTFRDAALADARLAAQRYSTQNYAQEIWGAVGRLP
ncbi:glycosyltransferase [Arthrobacter sp. LAPM80]|uniref:glycosyltransferase n=1 Tax=Arthrobacter sp. LAPM80 TaxID=3141788 RepID=UPI00398ADECF